MSTHLIYTCAHASPEVDNKRFDYLGQLIYDLRPDLVVDLGDFDDMKSLNSYDTRHPQAIVAQSYQADIEHGQEARDRIWRKFSKMKRKRPHRVGFAGNHKERINKALSLDPRLEGEKYGVSFGHLQTDYWYDTYHPYENSAPALSSYDGILYGHFVASGNYGTAMSGEHHAYNLLKKLTHSVTVGHSHKFNHYYKGDARPNPIQALVAGCFKGADESWAGQANNEWRKGVAIKRNVEEGNYDLEWVSIERLEREYGK